MTKYPWVEHKKWGRIRKAAKCPQCGARMITYDKIGFLPRITKCPRCAYSPDN